MYINKVIIFFTLFFVFFSIKIYAKSFDDLVNLMESSNHDLKISKLKNQFLENNISLAKSLYYPKLSSSWVANDGKDPDNINTSGLNSSISSASPGIPGVPSSQSAAGSQSLSTDGWSGDLSVSFPLFNRFLTKTSVDNSKLDYQGDLLSLKMAHESKKNQLSQLLMEFHSLKRIQKTLNEGVKLLERNNFNNQVSSKENRLKREEFTAEMNFNFAKVNMGIESLKMALKDLVPELTEEDFNNLPNINVSYELGHIEKLKNFYRSESRELKLLQMTEKKFENTYEQTGWEKPYVPFVLLQGSYSQSAAFQDESASDTWRISLLVSFNLFDGFYTQTRRTQAFQAKEISRLRTSSEIAKNSILLTKSYFDVKTARAEYIYKSAGLAKKLQRLKMIDKLANSGIELEMEKTSLLLEAGKIEWEALEAKKKEQQALLFIAMKTDNLDGVKFNEIP